MRSTLRGLSWDLGSVALWALVAALATALPVPDWLRIILLVPLVLLLPGYAVTAATFQRPLPAAENLVYTIAFSLCAAILGGVLLQLVLPLTTKAWALLLTAITVVACFLAAHRRRQDGVTAPPLPSLPRIGIPAVVLFGVALGIAAWSIALATDGAHDQAAEARFTSLWMVPRAAEEGGGALVGVENQEGTATEYQLVVSARGKEKARRVPLDLVDGETLTIELGNWATPEEKGTVAKLYRDGQLYRQVRLSPEARL